MRNVIVILAIFTVVNLYAGSRLDPIYHTNEEIITELDSLQNLYPDLVMVQLIGWSTGASYCEPMPIYACKISDNVQTDEDEPSVMYAGQCHAEEVLGVEITMYMINDILEHRFQAPYSIWIQNIEMWFVPTYNPEGLEIVWSGLDDSFRKNQRDNNMNGIFDFEPGPGGDIDGVDPNRNYSFNWIHGDSLYAEGNEEWNDYYRGPAPFSEGGTQAIRDLAAQQHFIYSINWHSSRTGNFSEKVFYSFKWDGPKYSPDFTFNEYIGQMVAGLIEKENGSGFYQPEPSLGRKGSAHDWFYKAHGTTQLLIECGTYNLQPDPPIVIDTCERCSVGAYWLLNRAIGYQTDKAMLTGHVSSAVTGDPLVAEVIVEQHKATFFDPRLTDQLYGRLWRQLMPGTYDVRIRKEGYEEQLIENVTVNNSNWTTLDVELQPLGLAIISGTVTGNNTPLEAEIIVYGLENDTIYTDESGSFGFDQYEGELKMRIRSDGYVPEYCNNILIPGTYEMDIELEPSVEIFQEDWESGFGNWIVQGGWGINTADNGNIYVEDSPNEFYQHDTEYILTTGSMLNLNGVDPDVVLMFNHKYYVEHDNDNCFVEISTNGNDWQELASWTGLIESWQLEVLELEEYIDNQVYLRFRLQSDDTLNDPGWKIDDIIIISSTGSSADDDIVPIYISHLYDNYPNPFNPETKICFSLADAGKTRILIYNLKGQIVKSLVDEILPAGYHEFIWSGEDNSGNPVGSGIYFYRLVNNKFDKSKKMILIK